MAINPIPAGYNRAMPYLISADAVATLDFAVAVFGAEVIERVEHAPGVIMHAEARIGDSVVMLAQGCDQWPAVAAMVYVYVEDVDAAHERALALGATSVKAPETQFYGDRSCMVNDAGGIQWGIATHVEDVSPEELERRAAQYKGAAEPTAAQ